MGSRVRATDSSRPSKKRDGGAGPDLPGKHNVSSSPVDHARLDQPPHPSGREHVDAPRTEPSHRQKRSSK